MSKPSETEAESMARKLREACALHDAGVRMMRQNLRRRHPDASAEEIERMLVAWLHTRPGAEQGDGPQRPEGSEGPQDRE